jgi:radical SAM superfamily enzyme YgiQ (UPF0313 family)
VKVLLADPPQLFLDGSGVTRQVQPLGLGYIGACLQPDHDVRFLLPDTRKYEGDDPWGELDQVIRDEQPDLVGLTAVTATYPSARRFAARIKAVNPEITVVLGGVHASTEPEAALLGAPGVDFVVRGEGERTLCELADGHSPESVPGLFWRGSDGSVVSSGVREPIRDLDALPFPLRENLIWPEDIHPSFYQALVTLRGCPYRCVYCAVPSSNDRLTRYRSCENVVDEIAFMREQYDVPALFFHDSVFTLHRKRSLAICDRMIERGLTVPFHCQTRTDRVDRELLTRMKAAGCEQIFFGIESGDVESLRRIRKEMPLEEIRAAVRLVKELDIRCTGFFMIGFPWETEALMEKTADFATSLGLDAVSLFSATPLPGTELWDLAGGDHLPDSIDFTTPQVNTTALSNAEYSEVFSRIRGRIDEFNQERMMARVSWLS